MSESPATPTRLARSLGPLMIWGLGVGFVISGMYFGWNLGLPEGGTLGLGIATLFIILLYLCFTLSYAELACAIPRAGGAFDYALRALGSEAGFLAGIVQLIEFIFAPPAIAAAIGAYFHLFFPQFSIKGIALTAYILFTAINIYGVKAAATLELLVTIFAVGELLVFAGFTLPHFRTENLRTDAFPHGWTGVWACVPFALWFFLGLEGVANVAEETVKPQRNILLGFGSALGTLILLCALTFLGAVGVGGWEAVVYPSPGAPPSDSPLPLALSKVLGPGTFLFRGIIGIGIMGLIASFHGIILAAGRASFELGRIRFVPHFIGKVHPKFRTPANALLVNMLAGMVALLLANTADIITLSCFGALSLYIISMISLLVLRRKDPELKRPFRVPLYPYFPIVALILSGAAFLAMISLNINLSMVYLGMLTLGYIWFQFFVKKRIHEQ